MTETLKQFAACALCAGAGWLLGWLCYCVAILIRKARR